MAKISAPSTATCTLMWPDTEENLRGHMEDLSERAKAYGRKLDYGLRVHVIVRETEQEAQ